MKFKMNKIITLKHLKTFNKVVELKSFTAAAESLFMTQPAVSQHIKKIEDCIGFNLFSKDKRFELTREGSILLSYSNRAFCLHDELLFNLNNNNLKKYKIAIHDTFIPLFIDVIENFKPFTDKEVEIISFSEIDNIKIFDFHIIVSYQDFDEIGWFCASSLQCEYILYNPNPGKKNLVYSCNLSYFDVVDITTNNDIQVENINNKIYTNSCKLINAYISNGNAIVISPEWMFKKNKSVNNHIRLGKFINVNIFLSEKYKYDFDVSVLDAVLSECEF